MIECGGVVLYGEFGIVEVLILYVSIIVNVPVILKY